MLSNNKGICYPTIKVKCLNFWYQIEAFIIKIQSYDNFFSNHIELKDMNWLKKTT